jgi:hypothetical protein
MHKLQTTQLLFVACTPEQADYTCHEVPQITRQTV